MTPAFSVTRTGGFPIGFRRLRGWQQDLKTTIAWAKENRFGVIDLGGDAAEIAADVIAAGLRIGSADLPDMRGMISPDTEKRAAAVKRNRTSIETCAQAGVRNFFVVMVPENPELPRKENFDFMVESYSKLVPTLEKADARIVIEGWPGPGALCCTPETLREFFQRVASKTLGINFDPSHLVRMGIDPLRFLGEFSGRVHHIHGKDTELLPEKQYDLGTEQPATFTPNAGWGGTYWRYTIPGHGIIHWGEIFRRFHKDGYKGCVSVELEDANFNGSEEGEKMGFTFSRTYLESC